MYTSLLKYSVICLALTVSAAAAAAPAPIVFFDIAGPDAAKLKTFYGANFGWTIDPTGGIATPHLPGTFRQDPPETLIYLAVPDIGAALKGILASGGSVVMPRMVVPNVVTFARTQREIGWVWWNANDKFAADYHPCLGAGFRPRFRARSSSTLGF